jgi:hypothetical protein
VRKLIRIFAIAVVLTLASFAVSRIYARQEYRKHIRQADAAWKKELDTARFMLPILVPDKTSQKYASDNLDAAGDAIRGDLVNGHSPDAAVAFPPDHKFYEKSLMKKLAAEARAIGHDDYAEAFDRAVDFLSIGDENTNGDLRDIRDQIENMGVSATKASSKPSSRP